MRSNLARPTRWLSTVLGLVGFLINQTNTTDAQSNATAVDMVEAIDKFALATGGFRGLFDTSVHTAPHNLDNVGEPSLVLGKGTVTFEAASDICVELVACPLYDLENVSCEEHRTIEPGADVVAVGTLLWAPRTTVACCSLTHQFQIHLNESCKSVLAYPKLNGDQKNIKVGTVTQLHRPDVQVAVADFMGFANPFILLAIAGGCGIIYFCYASVPSSLAGTNGSSHQDVLDSLRFAYSVSMISSCILSLGMMLINGLEHFDPVIQVAEVVGLCIGMMCFLRPETLRNFVGDDSTKCVCKKSAWSAGTFGATGNLSGVFPLVQGALGVFFHSEYLKRQAEINQRSINIGP